MIYYNISVQYTGIYQSTKKNIASYILCKKQRRKLKSNIAAVHLSAIYRTYRYRT